MSRSSRFIFHRDLQSLLCVLSFLIRKVMITLLTRREIYILLLVSMLSFRFLERFHGKCVVNRFSTVGGYRSQISVAEVKRRRLRIVFGWGGPNWSNNLHKS